jgi:branched-chain amino acid transport system permease protein
MKVSLNVRNLVAALIVALLVLLPLYSQLSGNIFVLTLFTRIVIFALAAVSLNLIMGYGGMMSFGHAAYLGIGGYAVGILAQEGFHHDHARVCADGLLRRFGARALWRR